ncbi:MAG: hypothetical protein D3910_00675, partial [Candidatus Electrothrix sp. ATG2]|nr:hypothetical protein [Candidatus Electrothrix sp. ATG2]
MNLIERIVAPDTLHAAWKWLARRRKDTHHNNDYWHLCHHRQELEPRIIEQLRNGTYSFSPCRSYNGCSVWSA